jgi:hypothetical protein
MHVTSLTNLIPFDLIALTVFKKSCSKKVLISIGLTQRIGQYIALL